MTETKNPANTAAAPPDMGADLAPTFANRFYVIVGSVMTRVAFGEFIAGDPNADTRYHIALSMQTENALQLANLILSLHETNLRNEALLRATRGAEDNAPK